MCRLEDIHVGSIIKGLTDSGAVKITDVEWHGNVLEVTYRTADGATDSQLVYRDDEEHLEIATTQLPWTFGADANQMRLVSEAYRISLAHLFDPYLAVHTSSVEPLPHQISAVYQDMLPKVPLRYILADDPGAGKTIMTGLYIKELIARGDLKRCLIVSPGNLVEQWQDELFSKFHLRFTILTNDQMEAAVTGNIFTEVNYAICRMDKLARDEDLKAKLKATEWDLIVVDEAHKMAATVFGNDVKYTKRFQLGRLLSEIARNYLLLTATPHNGKNEDFQLFLSLLDPDRFGLIHGKHGKEKKPDVSDVMRRLVKEELLKFDGTPLFPERRAYTVNYTLSPEEAELYQAVTHYVREEFNRADNLNKERKATVGFALTILQRRLASSPEAIYQSLRRRRERLEQRLTEVKAGKAMDEGRYGDWTDDMDEDDYLPEEMESREEQVLDHATAAATITELEAEIETLKNLEMMANRVRRSGKDRKWDELSKLLQDNAFMYGKDGQREKLIIFTEHKDTLNYLAAKIRSLLGDEKAVVTIHGGMARQDRRNVEALFKQDVNVRILIATDAAGEGINLQRAHLMINYDLPWNPNRLEQRFGRIHRIGQTEVCHLWNLVANETREGYVFQRLLSKLEEERKALGGRVFDILGKITFENKSLKDLLVEAIRYGNDPDVKARMNRIVDSSMDPEVFKKLMKERALTSDVMDTDMVMGIKEDMERMEAHKLQPHFIEAFFLEAFREIGGQVTKREKGRYQITRVPYVLRQQQRQAGYGAPVLPSYERICFDKEDVSIPGKPEADLVCPGHPLLEAVISVVKERDGNLLKEGTIFINDNDDSQDARLLFYIEDAVRDGVELAPHVYRVISKHIHFVEMKEDGTASSAGYAPYLDYRAPTEEEKGAVKKWMKVEDWITQNPEKKAKDYAIEYLIPAHFEEVKKRKCAILDKTEREVRERLTEEIQYWDGKAAELEEKERAGKPNAHLNSQMASRRADELEQRRKERLKEIEKERNLKRNPPVITGGALVIPKGLLNALLGSKKPDTFSQGDRKSMEMAAMEEVMAIERSFGYLPKDVSLDKVGYDIESTIPPSLRKEGEPALRFIEVKGRQMGATTVTVSKNEILTALNKPEEFILAVVEVDGEKKHTVYMKHPFTASPDFSSASVNYDLQKLKENADILYEK